VTAVQVHHFTVDVEEYFQVSAFEPYVSRERWDALPSRVEASVGLLLELLARHNAHGTFFVLSWVAERHRAMVKEIAAAGHEVASHGWDHARVTQLTPQQFRESVRRSKAELEAVSGQPIAGFRAPSYSIVNGLEWALDILVEEGYTYDSSLFPVRRRGYGYAGGERDPHWLARPAGRLYEVPPSTLQVCGVNLPAAGGAYFRIFPYALVAAAIKQAEARGVPATFYIHPWELDPEQPSFPVSRLTRFRHYTGLSRTVPRLERLLSQFQFTAIADTLARASVPAA